MDLKSRNTTAGDGDDIRVPAHIQMEGYDSPQYANTQYPWDGREDVWTDEMPTKFNPVASYVKYFTLPESFFGGERVFISFQGAESGMALWLNGAYVGYSEDSYTVEFERRLTLRKGENKLAVQVFKWTIGSWCEDQDFFRFSGIFRSVYLYMIPKTHLCDIKIRPQVAENLSCGTLELDLCSCGSGSVRMRLVGARKALIWRRAAMRHRRARRCLLWRRRLTESCMSRGKWRM